MTEEKITRRGVFKKLSNGFTSAFASYLEEKTKKIFFRPPKSIEEELLLTSCKRCGGCIEACPHNLLTTAEAKTGVYYGTPILELDDNYCRLCYSCVDACSTGVLKAEAEVNLGKAKLIKDRCLAYQGGLCAQCYYNCPQQDKALVLNSGKPSLNSEDCLGCGSCSYFCPQAPTAIKVKLI
ncbi:4Fe-4S dicluster domain-containing protein [Fuchsiella alkaliacetigena]|uniref:4Fe-4S dicluster domain-containing protein n=1 Tax=Fuchsiella alkaliacetigena TaxID=957042 RepID=UPI00200B4A3B|nr:4Fe-4S dicluster domain-containing protein [Fuchsiella alkaliacetigena]MCK8824807.1 4Fe-4S dicluster domain-containing protein [Fuchsiella alkaliacetigena]